LLKRNHGLLTAGPAVGEASLLMYRPNQGCQIQVETLSMARDIVLPPEYIGMRPTPVGRKVRVFGERPWQADA
jgi:hypothetical protein